MSAPQDCPRRMHHDCVDVRTEISYWLCHKDILADSFSMTNDRLFVSILKFGYDGYLLLRQSDFEHAKTGLLHRFAMDPLQELCTWPCVEAACRGIWKRMLAAGETQNSLSQECIAPYLMQIALPGDCRKQFPDRIRTGRKRARAARKRLVENRAGRNQISHVRME